jgi:hypothetical protein
MFDSKGRWQRPTAEQVASLDPETRERFKAVEAAALECERATAATKAASEHVADCVVTVRTCEERLRELRPPVSAVDAARAWIRSQQQHG